MIQKKICILGAYAVGKTSLVQRFVTSLFSERYGTTVGVRIHKKQMKARRSDLNLIIWDLAGTDQFNVVRASYLKGAAGYVLVADGTRPGTLDTAKELQQLAADTLGAVPFVLLVNKSDLRDGWGIEHQALQNLVDRAWLIVNTSAKTGSGVEDAFQTLADRLLEM